jgi:phospholipid/cholesterol/gamma-HCH transport system substrate-binding protein
MQKQAPTFARLLTMVLFALSCFGLLLFLWLSFGGPIPLKPQSYRFKVAVPEAVQLGLEADVRIAGVNVGKVRKKELDPAGNRTLLTIGIEPKYAPIKRDARAILRQKTLLGETFLELTPGTMSAPDLPEDAILPDTQVVPTVQLDEIFNTFDPQTRQAFRTWQQDLASSFRGHGQDFSDVLGNLPAFAESGSNLLRVLNSEERPLSTQIRETGNVFAALNRDQGALRNLILNSAQVFRATAQVNDKLAETFKVFPVFLDESRLTMAKLRTFALNTDPLIKDLRPVARDLRPTLRDVRALAPDLKQTFVTLNPLIDTAQTGLPALNQTVKGLKPMLGATSPFLGELNPILSFIQLYQHQTADFIGGSTGNGIADKANCCGPKEIGHYLRQMSPNGIENFGFFRDRDPNNRGNTYLDPLFATESRSADRLMFPNWDCHPSGGEVGRQPPTGFNLPPLTFPPEAPFLGLNQLRLFFLSLGINLGPALSISDEATDVLHDAEAQIGSLAGTGRPACFVQGPIPWHHLDEGNNRYPHVWSKNYSKPESPATARDLRP